MTESNVLTLPAPDDPPKRRKPATRKATRPRHDPTNATRQQRHRQKRQDAAAAVLPTVDSNVTPAPATSVSDAPARGIPWSVWPLAGTAVGLMAVSLTHLSEGVVTLTSIPVWQG
jgi:hypothetical protein